MALTTPALDHSHTGDARRFYGLVSDSLLLQSRSLLPPLGLNFDVNIDQRNCGWCNPRDARSLDQRFRRDVAKLFLHPARQPTDGPVVKPIRNAALLSLLQAVNSALLLVEIAGVLDLDLKRLELITDFGGNLCHRGHGGRTIKKIRDDVTQHGRDLFNSNCGTLQHLCKRLADACKERPRICEDWAIWRPSRAKVCSHSTRELRT